MIESNEWHTTRWQCIMQEQLKYNHIQSGIPTQNSVYIVHSPTNVLLLNLEHIKVDIKIHINVAPTCFGLRPSSGTLYRAWLKLHLC